MKLSKKILLLCFISILPARICFSQNTGWKEIGKMKFPVSGGQVVFNGSKTNPKFYILGGYSQLLQNVLKVIQVFDPLTNTFDVYNWDMKSPRVDFVAACWDSSIVYFGGGGNDSLEIFNFIKKQAPIIVDHNNNFNRSFSSGSIVGDELYVISGNLLSHDILPFIVAYNLKTKNISFKSNDPSTSTFNSSGDASIFQADGKLYILGGIVNKFATKSIRIFDVAKKTLQTDINSTTLLKVRAGASATYISSSKKGIIVGGYDETTTALKTAEQITINADGKLNISMLPSLKYARKNPMLVSYNNRVYAFGGTDSLKNVVSQIEMYTDSLTTDIIDSSIPSGYYIEQNYPNPFNPITSIKFGLPKESNVTLRVFNILGKEISTLVNKVMSAGIHTVNFDAGYLASGMYIYRFESGSLVQFRKMMLIK